MMGIYMPLLLGWFAYTLAAGLALYFVVSNTLAIAQALLMKRFRSEPEPAPSGKKKKKAIEEQKPEETGIRGLLASTQASLMKRLNPPESDGQSSNSGDGSKDQSKQSGQKKADAKGS